MSESAVAEWMPIHLFLQAHPGERRRYPGGDDGLKLMKTLGLAGVEGDRLLRKEAPGDIFRADYPDWADKEIQACEKAGISIVTCDDPGYPTGLRRLFDPPVLLYMRGRLRPGEAGAVAVVGSRRATPYGERVAFRLAQGLAEAGVTVVSGLARGVDGAAHRGALEGGGHTVAVLGAGMNRMYPMEHQALADRIGGTGALMTEFPLDAAPLPHHFPVRNRILAALTDGVIVVEAARDSGSLITASLAAEIGLFVGAVPGSILSRTSQGCNDLIFDGATPVRGVDDILAQLPRGACAQRSLPRPDEELPPQGLTPAGARVLNALSDIEARTAEELAHELQLASGALLGHLLELEIRGLAVRVPGDLFLRK
ncbi:MAG: DNA-processing protein DprA [Candidatus Polarisedimenticolia bacterium]